MSAHDLLIMMGVVLVASIGTQLLAAWLKLPAILPLLVAGVLLGPEVLGLVTSDALGVGLRVLIPLMVAVIVFEGGMVLDLDYLRQVGPVVRNLITEAGIRAMSPLAASVMVLDNLLRRPSTLQLLSDLDAGKEVREAPLRNAAMAGRALKEIRLDGDVLVAMVRREGRLFVPHGATVLHAGDLLTLIGVRDDVAAAAELFERLASPQRTLAILPPKER